MELDLPNDSSGVFGDREIDRELPERGEQLGSETINPAPRGAAEITIEAWQKLTPQ